MTRRAVKALVATSLLLVAGAIVMRAQNPPPRPVVASAGLISEISDPVVAWRVDLGGSCADEDRIVVGDFLIINVRDDRAGRVEARRLRDGAVVWQSAPGGEPGGFVGDTVVVTRRDHVAGIALASGRERWRFTPENNGKWNGGGFSSPPAVDGENVYVGEYTPDQEKFDAVGPSRFFCVDGRSGKLQWEVTLPTGMIRAGPAFDADHVYVVREYGVSCVSKRERRIVWSNGEPPTSRAPPTPWRQTLLVPTQSIDSLNGANGERRWRLRGGVMDTRITVRDDVAYTPFPQHQPGDPNSGTFVRTYVALDPASGDLLWQRQFPDEVRDSGVITRDSVYLTCWDKHLYRLDRRDGSVVWKLPVGGSADPIGHDGALYMCMGKTLVCVKQR